MQTFYSWNVNGIRAVQSKGIFSAWLAAAQPDILGIQETKATPDQLDDSLLKPEGYHTYWASSTIKKGYSGVALFTKREPYDLTIGLGIPEYDQEGRTITADFGEFVFITAYFPSGSNDPEGRVPFKLAYTEAFTAHCQALRARGKSVIFCGDVNTAHRPIDLARPKQNEKTSGFLPEERAMLDKWVDEYGYIDTWRHKHPDTVAYSWWSNFGGARAKNVGWRIDYFFITPDLLPRLADAHIHADVLGSDHCPISVTLV